MGKRLVLPNCSVYTGFLKQSNLHAARYAILCHERKLTFAELYEAIDRCAAACSAMGIKSGDIVPICLPACPEAVILFFALNKIGAISSFLNQASGTVELREYIQNYSAQYFVCTSATVDNQFFSGTNLKNMIVISWEKLFENGNKTSEFSQILIGQDKDYEENARIFSWEAFMALGDLRKVPEAEGVGKTDAFIAYTSGSTGAPKAILLTNENILAEMYALKKTTYMQWGPKAPSLQVVPLNYPYGFIVSVLLPLFARKTVALTPVLMPSRIAAYLRLYKPAYVNAIPSFYKAFLNDPAIRRMDLSFLKYAVSGGDKLDFKEKLEINRFLKTHGSRAVIADGNGNGEGCGSLTNPVTLFGAGNIRSIGRPIYGLSVKFTDESGNPVPLGLTGRFCFSGKNLMKGYYKDEAATAAVKYKDNDGVVWFHSDTFGHMDAKGWCYFDGRDRRFFITFNETGAPYKVYCDHVQEVIKDHPSVMDGAVVQCPDKFRGLVPIAYVVWKRGISAKEKLKSREELRHLCEERMQQCAIPVRYEELDELPLNMAGKVDYRALEEMAIKAKIKDESLS